MSIDPSEIEAKLTALWEEQQDSHTLRASLFNLIAFAPDPGRKEALQHVVDALVEKFPCRILMIEQQPIPMINIDVSTHYIGKLSGDTIGCDLISIQTPAALLERIPFLITPHLMADLPVYLLWGDDPTLPNPVFAPLMKLADRLLFETAASPFDFAPRMHALMSRFSQPIIDLNWERLSGWKSLLTKTFQSHRIDSIEMRCGSGGIPALYLQGWWASLHHQKIHEIHHRPGSLVTIFDQFKGSTTLTNEPKIEEVILRENGNEFLYQKGEGSLVLLHVTRGNTCDMPQTFPLSGEMDSFRFWKDVFYSKNSDEYHSLLKALIS